MYLVKLVRDRVEDLLEDGGTMKFAPVDHRTHRRLLRNKLVEEALEAGDAPGNLTELADAFEALRGLAELDGFDMATVIEAANRKREERGGYALGVAMFNTAERR